MARTWRLRGAALGLALLAGCAAQSPAPIVDKGPAARPPATTIKKERAPRAPEGGTVYRVQPGDTLYSIAWRFGVDHRQIASWNRLANPDRILVGQELRLAPPAAVAGTPASPKVASAAPPAAPAAVPLPPAATPLPPAATPQQVVPPPPAAPAAAQRAATDTRNVGGVAWSWPAQGKASRAVAATGSIGLEIRGERGAPVRAAAPGQVVYSGNGLRGYGQLIIIKHNDTFLSAYAHNDELLITEGARVDGGQQIARMGDSEASDVMLHFEIRKGGKAVEPLQYLPQR